ncbi:MAG: hypothetical protein ACRENB_09685 [Gemmatimonadales bacterium]
MTPCGTLSERMVDAAHGRYRWTPEESAHLAECAECGLEWRLVRGAIDLGRSDAVDVERVAGAVLRRMNQSPPAPVTVIRRRALWLAALPVAAALALVVGRNAVGPGPDRSVPGLAQPAAVLTELDDLSSTELQTVLDALDPTVNTVGAESGRLGDLNAQELERILRSLEG